MAAWSAKVSKSVIWIEVNGLTARRPQPTTPIGLPSWKIGTARNER